MSADGIIICESAKNEEFPHSVGDFVITKEKKYGKSKLTYYRKGNIQ
jgi:16S rRNA G966 N2-methylase RsmD